MMIKTDRRKKKNWILQPVVQLRLGLYSILLSLLFSCVTGVFLYFVLADFGDFLGILANKQSSVYEFFVSYIKNSFYWYTFFIVFYLSCTVLVSIVATHRLVGPTYAFRRHIRQLMAGDFEAETILRKGDAFQEVAIDLNDLSEYLKANYHHVKHPRS